MKAYIIKHTKRKYAKTQLDIEFLTKYKIYNLTQKFLRIKLDL